jgi:hypothetical protein
MERGEHGLCDGKYGVMAQSQCHRGWPVLLLLLLAMIDLSDNLQKLYQRKNGRSGTDQDIALLMLFL